MNEKRIEKCLKSLEKMPNTMYPDDLIKIGLYKSIGTFYNHRYYDAAPISIKKRGHLLLKKNDVKSFLLGKLKQQNPNRFTFAKDRPKNVVSKTGIFKRMWIWLRGDK